MKSLTEILRQYEIAYRDLVTFKTRSTNPNAKDALILNELRDWSFICTALDVIGDSTLAIKNFLDYGLEGLTDGNNDGEKYLRLYGVLNATYLQQEAIGVLYRKINLQKSENVKQKIENLKIRDIRIKIGSHSSDYKKGLKGDRESYIPIRNSMRGYKFCYQNNERIAEEIRVDLTEPLTEHLNLIIDLLDEAYEMTIKTVYRGNKLKQNEELSKLAELRKLKDKIANDI
jgi:hypothetical protein